MRIDNHLCLSLISTKYYEYNFNSPWHIFDNCVSHFRLTRTSRLSWLIVLKHEWNYWKPISRVTRIKLFIYFEAWMENVLEIIYISRKPTRKTCVIGKIWKLNYVIMHIWASSNVSSGRWDVILLQLFHSVTFNKVDRVNPFLLSVNLLSWEE